MLTFLAVIGTALAGVPAPIACPATPLRCTSQTYIYKNTNFLYSNSSILTKGFNWEYGDGLRTTPGYNTLEYNETLNYESSYRASMEIVLNGTTIFGYVLSAGGSGSCSLQASCFRVQSSMFSCNFASNDFAVISTPSSLSLVDGIYQIKLDRDPWANLAVLSVWGQVNASGGGFDSIQIGNVSASYATALWRLSGFVQAGANSTRVQAFDLSGQYCTAPPCSTDLSCYRTEELNEEVTNDTSLVARWDTEVIPRLGGLCSGDHDELLLKGDLQPYSSKYFSVQWSTNSSTGYEAYVVLAVNDTNGDMCAVLAGCDGGASGAGFCNLTIRAEGQATVNPIFESAATSQLIALEPGNYTLNVTADYSDIRALLYNDSGELGTVYGRVGFRVTKAGVIFGRDPASPTCVRQVVTTASLCKGDPGCNDPYGSCGVNNKPVFSSEVFSSVTPLLDWQLIDANIYPSGICGTDHDVSVFKRTMNPEYMTNVSAYFTASSGNAFEAYILLMGREGVNNTRCVAWAGCDGGWGGGCNLTIQSSELNVNTYGSRNSSVFVPLTPGKEYILNVSSSYGLITASLLDGSLVLATVEANIYAFTVKKYGLVLGRNGSTTCVRRAVVTGRNCSGDSRYQCTWRQGPCPLQGSVSLNQDLTVDRVMRIVQGTNMNFSADGLCGFDHDSAWGSLPVQDNARIRFNWTASSSAGFQAMFSFSASTESGCNAIAGCDGGFLGQGYCNLTVYSWMGDIGLQYGGNRSVLIALSPNTVYTNELLLSNGSLWVRLYQGSALLGQVGPVYGPLNFDYFSLIVGRSKGGKTCVKQISVDATICAGHQQVDGGNSGRICNSTITPCTAPRAPLSLSYPLTQVVLPAEAFDFQFNLTNSSSRGLCSTNYSGSAGVFKPNFTAEGGSVRVTFQRQAEALEFQIFVLATSGNVSIDDPGCMVLVAATCENFFCGLRAFSPENSVNVSGNTTAFAAINPAVAYTLEVTMNQGSGNASLFQGSTLVSRIGPFVANNSFNKYGFGVFADAGEVCVTSLSVSGSVCGASGITTGTSTGTLTGTSTGGSSGTGVTGSTAGSTGRSTNGVSRSMLSGSVLALVVAALLSA